METNFRHSSPHCRTRLAAREQRCISAWAWLPIVALAAAACVARPVESVLAPPGPDLPPPQYRLPRVTDQGHVGRAGARIWYGSIGSGAPVILLHGGRASSRSWSAQVPALLGAGYRVILIDSRGHGRSTLGARPLSYQLMADDVLAVMDHLRLKNAAVVGWSDGAIIGLVLAMHQGERLSGVYAFGANMDQRGVKPDAADAPILKKVGPRLVADYAALSPTPGGFAALHEAVRAMQRAEPNFAAAQLRTITGPPILIAAGEQDEFITNQHPIYLAHTIPGARLETFPGTGHFAPWERPAAFNRSLLRFLTGLNPHRQAQRGQAVARTNRGAPVRARGD